MRSDRSSQVSVYEMFKEKKMYHHVSIKNTKETFNTYQKKKKQTQKQNINNNNNITHVSLNISLHVRNTKNDGTLKKTLLTFCTKNN